MSSLDLRLYQEIEKSLGELLEKYASELVLGRATDYSDYRFRIGQLKGLRDALSLAEEANKRIIGIREER